MNGFFASANNKYFKLSVVLIVLSQLLFVSTYVYAQAEYARNKIKYLTSITGYGEQIKFSRPRDIFVDSYGEIYIADYYKKAVFIFDKHFMPVAIINEVNGLSARPLSVAVNEEGMIFIAEEGTGGKQGRLLSFNFRGEFQKQIKIKGFEGADDLSIKDLVIDKSGNLYLAGGEAGLVIVDKTGKYIRSIRPEETKKGEMQKSFINKVELGKEGWIFLLSRSAPRIYVYNSEGKFLFKFGKLGGTTGALSTPRGIAVDSKAGVVYVMDYMRHTLIAYKIEGNEEGMYKGEYFFEYGGQGNGPGWFNFPNGIFLTDDGKLFVADSFNKRVQVFTAG